MDADGEAGLVRKAASGDRPAFDRLGDAYRPRLEKFAALMGVNEVEDVVQESLNEAFQSLANFKGRSKFSSWMFGITLNLCRRWHRVAHANRKLSGDRNLDRPDPRSSGRSVLSSLVKKENAERIALALDRIPPTFREAFVLKHGEGMDFAEIGEITGTSAGTARVRAHRAKFLLQASLGPSFLTLLGSNSREEDES